MKLVTVTSTDLIREKLEPLSKTWEQSGEFWPLDSCIKTMASSEKVLSAAAEIDHVWRGWYLAVKQGDEWELLFIYCDQAFRGQKIGRRLLEHLVTKAKHENTESSIFLEVRKNNLPAIKLYESIGFVQIMTRPNYYKNGDDALVYKLEVKRI